MQLLANGKGYPLRLHVNKQTLFRMKLITLLLTAACVNVAAGGYSQNISLSVKDAPLQQVFKLIEKQTDYRFVYTKEQLQKIPTFTFELKNVTLEKALHLCLHGQPLSYTIEDNLVIIQRKFESSFFQFLDVKGKIVNAEGQPLIGITISVKGSGKATVTDNNGEFFLADISYEAVLVISGAETETREVKVSGKQYISVRLSQRISELDETMVIAYGKTTRRFSTGSVSKITADDISRQPISNPLAALQGRVPGLTITSTSGLPGASFIVQIRGQNSLNPNPSLNAGLNPIDNPLFIIDGVPFAPQNANINQFSSLASPGNISTFGNPYGGLSPFNSINPADIESIEVLRDADETAIYGSRGANGVILVTTKKGLAGQTKLNVNMATGQSKVTRTMRLLNTTSYLEMRREAFSNDGITPSATPGDPGYAPDLLAFGNNKYTDWKKYFLDGSATITDINTSLSGGTKTTNFLIGAGYRRDNYIIPGNFGNDRASFNMNLRHQSIDHKFLLELAANYSYEQNNSSGSPLLLEAFTLPPNHPDLIDGNGNLVWNYHGIALKNPLGYTKTKYKAQNYNLISHLQISYQIIPNLTLKTSLGYNNYEGNELSQHPIIASDPASNPLASSSFGTNHFKTWIIEPMAEFNKKIAQGKLSILVGGTYQQNTNSQTQVIGTGYANDNLLGSISAAGNITATDAFTEYRYIAVFGRTNYVWKDKYIVNLNGRRDGSSRFGKGRQFGNFGSVGTAWLFSEEKMIRKLSRYISYGKLRCSYGTTGSDNILDYQYLSRWATGLPAYQDIAGYTPQNLYNDQLHWSVNKKLEAGLELGFAADKLLTSVVWYRHRSNDQLVTYVLPTQTGFRGVTSNFPALVQNSGWEIQVSSVNISSDNFSWRTTINLTIPKNKLKSFPGIESSSYYSNYAVGQSLSLLKVFKYAGLDPLTGLYQFHSKTGLTSTPSEEDKMISGNLDPKFFGGFSNNIKYKEIQLDIFIEFKKQIGPNYLQQINNYPPGKAYNQPINILDRWRSPTQPGDLQKFTAQSGSSAEQAARYFIMSDGAYSNASYIRIKNISLSYSFKQKLLDKLKVKTIRVYINAQNLFTITNYKGNDPETRSFYSFPPLKTIVAGLQFNF